MTAASSPVHVELASMSEIPFLKNVSKVVFPYIDSLGLNEQELGDLYAAVTGKSREEGKNTPIFPQPFLWSHMPYRAVGRSIFRGHTALCGPYDYSCLR